MFSCACKEKNILLLIITQERDRRQRNLRSPPKIHPRQYHGHQASGTAKSHPKRNEQAALPRAQQPLDLTVDDDVADDETAAKRTIVYGEEPPPPPLHEYANEDMYEPVIASPGSRLPAPVKLTSLPARPTCKSYALPFTPEQLKYLQDTIWVNRGALLTHPLMWDKATPKPSRAVGMAAWLLNSSPELVTECYNMQRDKPYHTQHLRQPHRIDSLTYPIRFYQYFGRKINYRPLQI